VTTDRFSMTRSLPARALRAAAVLALPLSLGACEWFTDFKNQPRIEPWEPFSQVDTDTTEGFRGNPAGSVPVTGTIVAGYEVSYRPLPNVVDSLSYLENPVPVTEASLARGRMNYQINCAVCHGDLGDGNGTLRQLNPAYGFAPAINGAATQARTDGYIYGMMRNGRGLMKPYRRIEEMDRWDVVNYVRALQGLVDIPHETGPVGMPGQNGATVPGPSASAPARPAPFMRPTIQLTPGSSGANAATTGRDRYDMGTDGHGGDHGDDHGDEESHGEGEDHDETAEGGNGGDHR
jgi:mono/diheme cytochrome c family protein